MTNRNIIAVGVTALLLVACGGDESAAKKAVLANLKDPDSAKFGKFSLAGTKGACLTVNAKNSMGGYTGDQQALLSRKEDNSWMVLGVEDQSHDRCIAFASALFKSDAK
jgi:hypothetical protein